MFPRLPAVTKALLIANGIAYLAQMLLGQVQTVPFMLWPFGAETLGGYPFQIWQLLTYGFMHGGTGHLLMNMLALAMFGAPVEAVWGSRRYATFYFVCLLGAALCQLLVGWWMMRSGEQPYPTVGASGGVFGLLLAYGMLFPNQRVMLLIPPIPMKARTLVIAYGALTLAAGLFGWMPGVAHFAHLGGMLFGWLLIRYWRSGRKPPSSRPPLRAVN